jgi:hypothetical protein
MALTSTTLPTMVSSNACHVARYLSILAMSGANGDSGSLTLDSGNPR